MWKRWVMVAALVLLGACTLPGHSGWECDNDGDCSSGLTCRSVHGSKGYSSVCLAPGETVAVGTGNWLRLLIWPLIGISVGVAVISRIAASRKRDGGGEYYARRRRR